MGKYLIKRLLLTVPTLLGSAILVFMLLRMAPGDICEVRLLGSGLSVDQEQLDLCRKDLGLDEPKIVQFFDFVKGFFILDLGKSM